jgi:hypothetical protein
LRASPESSAHGSRSISHGDANAGVCASGGRAGRRPQTSCRRGADARRAPSRHTNFPEGQRVTDFAEDDHVRRISRLGSLSDSTEIGRPMPAPPTAARTGDLLGATKGCARPTETASACSGQLTPATECSKLFSLSGELIRNCRTSGSGLPFRRAQ